MGSKTQIGRTAVFNWLTLAAALGVGFFLSPFIVRRLGSEGYGIWTLVNSLVAYMSLLDLGLRGAVTRYVSRYHAQRSHDEAGRAVSAAFWLRIWIGLSILLVSLLLSLTVNKIVTIPAEMQTSASWALIIVGTSLAISITFGIFGAVLAGLQRFDLLCCVGLAQSGLRTVGAIWLLKGGHGIVALALWELIVVVASNVALTALSLHVYSEIRVLFRRPDSTVLRQLAGYSFYVFVLNVCHQVINYTDNVVVGAFVGIGAVTVFTIAGGLLEYTRQMVSALGLGFLPLASSLEARGEHDQLRRLLVQGTRATLLIGLPIEAGLFFRGRTFIGLWMGGQYAAESGAILQLLLIAQAFLIADYTVYNVACGLGKHKAIAFRMMAEAGANFVLSVVLARKIGLMGVALGTLIPSVINHLFFGPRYICKILEIPVRQFLWQSWVQPLLAVAPFAFACYWAEMHWAAGGIVQFAAQMIALCPILIAGIALCFWNETSSLLRSLTRWSERYRHYLVGQAN